MLSTNAAGLSEVTGGLAGRFDPSVPTSALVEALGDDVVLFAVPIPGLTRTKAEGIATLVKAFGAASADLRVRTLRHGLSGDGQHGFSYGFMDVTANGKITPGKYVAYWTLADDRWRAAAFKWQPRAEGAAASAPQPSWFGWGQASPAAVEAAREAIDRIERAFSDDAQGLGLGKAFRKYGEADSVNLGPGPDFLVGKDAIAEAQGGDASKGSPVRWAPDGVLAAGSADLGLSFGYLQVNGKVPEGRLDRIPFFTIWRRSSPGSEWRYVAE